MTISLTEMMTIEQQEIFMVWDFEKANNTH